MPRKNPFLNVSAVVAPAIAEEIDRLATAHKVSRSAMVRQLLEERLTQRANERLEKEHEKLEKRLQRIENRFAALMVKCCKASAQSLYLTMKELEDFTEVSKDDIHKYWEGSRQYAAKFLQAVDKQDDEP
jgi:metal-responsive CopG/Arc/MetJ family transcriptional regulator